MTQNSTQHSLLRVLFLYPNPKNKFYESKKIRKKTGQNKNGAARSFRIWKDNECSANG